MENSLWLLSTHPAPHRPFVSTDAWRSCPVQPTLLATDHVHCTDDEIDWSELSCDPRVAYELNGSRLCPARSFSFVFFLVLQGGFGTSSVGSVRQTISFFFLPPSIFTGSDASDTFLYVTIISKGLLACCIDSHTEGRAEVCLRGGEH